MNKTTSNQVFLLLFMTLFFSVSIHSNDMEHQHDMPMSEMDHQHDMPMSEMEHHDMNESSMHHEMHNAAHLVPIGIMGGEVHMKGHFMMSIKQMRMSMEGNSNDDISLSDSEIINLPNPYTMMNMPSKLSVVPQEMEMNMTMIGGMYGVSDRQTLMFMGMYIEKDMNLLTYSPMMSRNLLGGFSSKTQGLSSVSIDCLSATFIDADEIDIGDINLKGIYSPGHTDDSYSFYAPKHGMLFSGDTLLIRGTGRTDFQNGDAHAQYDSLYERLLTLPEDTTLYSGHDYKGWTSSTLKEERQHNPRLQFANKKSYADFMMNLQLPNPKLMDIAVPANQACGNS